MHALFSRRFVVGYSSSSLELTKSVMMKKKLAFPHWSQSRHILSPLLSSSSVKKAHGFFSTALRNTNTLKSGSLLEARAGFFHSHHLHKPWVFTGFQKRGWKSWFNGANAVVFGLIIANLAVFTMWRICDRTWMAKNFVVSPITFRTGRIHTLITSGFSNVGTSQLIVNMIGLYYFGTSIARTLGPVYLLKMYFAGSLAGSLLYISVRGVMAILKSQGVSFKNPSKIDLLFLGAEGPVYAITLLDIFLYPKVTTYFAFIFRVPVMIGILGLGQNLVKVLEGKEKSLTMASINMGGGAIVAAIAWRQIRKGRFYY